MRKTDGSGNRGREMGGQERLHRKEGGIMICKERVQIQGPVQRRAWMHTAYNNVCATSNAAREYLLRCSRDDKNGLLVWATSWSSTH